MNGLHLTADFYGCNCNITVLTDPQQFLQEVHAAIEKVGLTPLQDNTYRFDHSPSGQNGFTSVVLLAESHVAVHTWPESRYVSADVFVCNHTNDNSNKARHVLAELTLLFKANKIEQHEMLRGAERGKPPEKNPLLKLEWLNDGAAFGFSPSTVLERRQSEYQSIEILDFPDWGRTLLLDGKYMTSEVEGFIYHELLVHPAMAAHGKASSILVLGGGDGCSINEILKYQSVESIDLVELDPEVIEVSRIHLKPLHHDAFEHYKVKIHVSDAQAYLLGESKKYDVILMDLTDDCPPANHLYTQEFFKLLQAHLAENGIAVMHCGTPFYNPRTSSRILKQLRNQFAVVRPFGAYIPLYGSYLLFAAMSQTTDVALLEKSQISEWLEKNSLRALQYYSPDMHAGIMTLPPFLNNALKS